MDYEAETEFDLSEYINLDTDCAINEDPQYNENNILNESNVIFGGAKEKVSRQYPEEQPVDIDETLTTDDMQTVLYAEIEKKGIAGHHINSMNKFYSIGIRQIIMQIFTPQATRIINHRNKTEEDRSISSISFNVEYTDVKLTSPTTVKYKSGKDQMLTPGLARTKNLTYSGHLYISTKITATATYLDGKTKTREEELKDFRIASIPIMVGSEPCNTYNQSKETLKQLEEDPRDPGGYFIIRGGEWVVDCVENILINGFHCYKNKHLNEIVRGEFISKPGDAFENSFYIILRYLQNGAITFEITTNKYDKLQIPYYLIFRAFGMTSDAEILNNIVYGLTNKDPITTHMLKILGRTFSIEESQIWNPIRQSTNPTEIIQYIAGRMNEYAKESGGNYKRDKNAVKYVNTSTLGVLDKYIFPHIGVTPAARIRKLKFLGHLIRRLLLVEMDILPSTDRDSFKNKRIHSAGVLFAKTFKTHFNFIIAKFIKDHLVKDFNSTPFSQVQLVDSVKAAVKTSGSANGSSDLERVLVQSITSGTKTITVRRNETTNRVQSEQGYRKNDLNFKSQLNNITATNSSAAKATERAELMRMVHKSQIGYICVSQSADTGEKVGMNKQIAVSASVCDASSSYALKDTLYSDTDLIRHDDVEPEDITTRKLAKVFVNGDWIGFCEHSHEFARKYRTARRYEDIHPQTTIVCEEFVRELSFWVDVGKLIRPLIIVYNNIREYMEAFRAGNREVEFKQWIKLTREHIFKLRARVITIDDLRRERVLEYISPEEQENCYIAMNLNVLRENKNNVLNQFTHVDIEQAIFGLVALSSPNGNHTASTRVTYFTNQKKQTCGWFALNWPFRIDKNTFLQHYCDIPLAKVFSDAITYPNGQNIILAYTMYSGQNQEDSAIVCKQSIERGLFVGSHFYYEKTELDKGESFGNDNYAQTMDMKKDAIYNYIEGKYIKEGTIAKKGYVLAVKRAKLPKPIENYIYTDRSLIYNFEEPAVVEKVIPFRNDEDVLSVKIKLRSYRPLNVGDKVSSRAGNKSIVSMIYDIADMPYCEVDGLSPDMLLNPHAVPTRMCIGQILEGVISLLAARKGCIFDSTTFKKIDLQAVMEELKSKGIKYGGHRQMYNGMTGDWIDTLVFVVPQGYNRLQKFVIDESYAMNSGPTRALTRQPTDGKSNNGGLKIGEMEKDVFCSHGSMRAFYEKFYDDSDGIDIPICRICGNRAIVNHKYTIYKCKTCEDNADIAMVPSAWISNVFFNEISSMNVIPKFELEPYTYSEKAP